MTGGRGELLLRQDGRDPAAGFPDLERSPWLRELSRLPAGQQPAWQDHPDLACIRAELTAVPALVDHRDVWSLRRALARVERGAAHLLQVGECAELFSMADAAGVARRLSLYQQLAERMAAGTGREVVLLARMAGQYAKPRSQDVELLPDGTEIPVYRGDAVNDREPTATARRADPWRLLTSYDRSRDTLRHLVNLQAGRPVYLSHEALLRDYEEPLTRGRTVPYASSGHLVWVGERTRHPDAWHVRWASWIANPVGVKIGPTATGPDAALLARVLNPAGESGRLSLILRLGCRGTAERVASVVGEVSRTGVPVLWQCDPLHANTRRSADAKVRLLPDVRAEIDTFVRVLRAHGGWPGGLHLEVTPEDVSECQEEDAPVPPGRADPPCDPRLNPAQALAVVDHFVHETTT